MWYTPEVMEQFYPLTFKPDLHTALWGTESWEISGYHAAPSVVAEGRFAGETLEALVRRFGRSFLGAKAPDPASFPLLFKVIEAKRRLSVQVHPNETTCRETKGEPKTEMWYVLGGRGPIFAGLKTGTTPAQVEEDVRTGRFEETLVRHEAAIGTSLYIPGGLVHAIGEDVTVYEVQQSSNTTYRLYDWGRLDANGRPRPLHVKEALASVDFTLPVPGVQRDVSSPFFTFRVVETEGVLDVPANDDSFTAIFDVATRQSVLVPAHCAASVPCGKTVLVTTL